MAAAVASGTLATPRSTPTPRSRASALGATGAAVLSPALELKEGHTAAAKSADWRPGIGVDGDADLSLAEEEFGGSTVVARRLETLPKGRRQLGLGGHTGLRHAPELPVSAGPLPNKQTVSLRQYKDDTRDWRKLPCSEVRSHFERVQARVKVQTGSDRLYVDGHRQSSEGYRQAEGLLVAVALGSLQACGEGAYWAPGFQDPDAVLCRDVRLPQSRVFVRHPDISKKEPRAEGPAKLCTSDTQTPLEACLEIEAQNLKARAALVRFVARGDPKGCDPVPGLFDFRQAQLYTRTSFLQALHDMPKQLHGDPCRLLGSSAVVCTSDVTVMRGPLPDGARWLTPHESTRVDVITVALPRHPHTDDQGQYARSEEKALVVEAVDGALAVAVEMGIDAVVFPPLGVDGGLHPAADAGDLLHKAVQDWGKYFSEVRVCREYPGQHRADWQTFVSAAESGRAAPKHKPLLSIGTCPYIRPGWTVQQARQAGVRPDLLEACERLAKGSGLKMSLTTASRVAIAAERQESRRRRLQQAREQNRFTPTQPQDAAAATATEQSSGDTTPAGALEEPPEVPAAFKDAGLTPLDVDLPSAVSGIRYLESTPESVPSSRNSGLGIGTLKKPAAPKRRMSSPGHFHKDLATLERMGGAASLQYYKAALITAAPS